jgi:exonuclease SbcC
VRVYSDEKNAFVDPIELSTGTQAQIHLAERLGFAEVLLLAKGLRGAHFLFLDEPLGGFDRERATGFIGLLREFTPAFPQIFFLAGDLKLAPVFDRVVRMDGAARELHFQGRMEVLVPEPEPQA